jgi:glycosyltransferase involved in cell wall biosynthesis
MTLSVVIPCYNEEHYVDKLLGDLTQQTTMPDSVFVVDCHSKDKTIKVAQRFSNKLPLSVLTAPYRSAASARNMGADAAKTDYILFLDADMRIAPDFVGSLKNRAISKQVDFVTPRLKIEGHHPADILFAWILNLWVYFYRMVARRQASGTAGGAMLISNKAHHVIGGYNPKLREFDDIDYIHRMWKHHITSSFDWRAVAVASNRRSSEQGRFATILQSIPDDYFLARHIVRPVMKKLGIKPKWHELN